MLDTEPAPIIQTSVAFVKSLPSQLKIGVASSDFPKNIQKHMEQAGLNYRINAMTSGEKTSGEVTRDKPHPDVYLVTAQKLEVDPVDCIAVEDTSPGIRAAKDAGMYCIGFRNPNSGKQDYSESHLVVDDLEKICFRELQGRFEDWQNSN